MAVFPKGCLAAVTLLSCFFLIPGSLFSQKANYPVGYFALPVYPGKPNTLSGALGDLRSNHFHAGIDVRTQQKVGLPITAAADGYVSRIAVQRAGYGKVMYIKHPNGMTTVYAHLDKFNEQIGTYVRAEQYKAQSFELDLTPEEGRFLVKKGELVAISGNTGSSEGPHLHFEIRDSRDNYLNPLFMGFPEIRDNTPPRFVNIALAPLTIGSRVNGKIDRQKFIPAPKSANSLIIKDTIRATGALGLELQAFDRMDGTGFNYGLNCIEVRVDGQEIFAFNMEKFPVDMARDYNYLINYKARVADRERYYKCYNPDGNAHNIYQTDGNRGKLVVNDTLAHEVEIKIFDSFENWSQLKFILKGEVAAENVATSKKETISSGIISEVLGDFVKVSALGKSGSWYLKGRRIPVEASYEEGGHGVFLWDLKKGLPDSIRVGLNTSTFSFVDKVVPGKAYHYKGAAAVVGFDERSLFDTLYLQVGRVGNTLQLNDYTDPLRGAIEVAYQPDVEDSLKGKTHIYRLVNGREAFVGGEWDASGVRFKTRELGTFYPLVDAEGPKVRVLESSPRLISARIMDDLSGIASFRAKVNGEWVLMNYEYKNSYIWSEKLDDALPFEGEVVLEVTDRAGNISVVSSKIAEPPRRKTGRK